MQGDKIMDIDSYQRGWNACLLRCGEGEVEQLQAEKAELEAAIRTLLDYREWTERIHEDAYDFVFKSGRHREAWNKLMLLTDWFPTPEPEDLSW